MCPNEKFLTDSEEVDFRAFSKKSKISAAKLLSKWFEVDVVIRMFGVVVFEWHFPPKETDNTNVVKNDSYIQHFCND